MKTYTKYLFVLLAAGAALLWSCKKEDDTLPTLSGDLRFEPLPAYVQKGDSFHIVATGVYRGSNRADSLVGYRMFNPLTARYDTLRLENEEGPAEADFVISADTLNTFTLNVYAFAKGYYGASFSSSFTIVNPSLDTLKGSLKGHQFGYKLKTKFNDERDGSTYYASSLSSGGWMLQNLAWDGAGIPFADCESMNYIAGRFYNWDEAQTACPAGWKLPSDADFVTLAGSGTAGENISGVAGKLKGDVYFNGKQLWPYNGKDITLTNETDFTAATWGYLTVSAGVHQFRESGVSAVFWTSDSIDAENGVARYIKADSNDFFYQSFDKKSFYASVRCIKE